MHKKTSLLLAGFVVLSIFFLTKKVVFPAQAVGPDECRAIDVICPDGGGDCYCPDPVPVVPVSTIAPAPGLTSTPVSTITPNPESTPAPSASDRDSCEDSDGIWKDQFPSSCLDRCVPSGTQCLQVITNTSSCDCGAGSCWDEENKTCTPNPSDPPKTDPPPSEKNLCEAAGGTWQVFQNGCADNCGAGPICTSVMTAGCECGENSCWDTKKQTCVGETIEPPISETPVPPEQCEQIPVSCRQNGICSASEPLAGWCSIADLNIDGYVDETDYQILSNFFLDSYSQVAATNDQQSPDINYDGRVDLLDYSIMVEEWNPPVTPAQ